MAAPGTLDWFTEVGGPGSVRRTTYARLHVWRHTPTLWRVLATDDQQHTAETGPPYRTQTDARLAVLYSPDLAVYRGLWS